MIKETYIPVPVIVLLGSLLPGVMVDVLVGVSAFCVLIRKKRP